MFDQLISKLSRIHTNSADNISTFVTQKSGGSEGTATDEGGSPDLFRCPSCDTVYVAIDKEACSNCGTGVKQVRSTLRDQ